MMSHDLAYQLLALPDMPVTSGIDRSGYGEAVLKVDVVAAKKYDTGVNEDVIDLVLDDSSSHSTLNDD